MMIRNTPRQRCFDPTTGQMDCSILKVTYIEDGKRLNMFVDNELYVLPFTDIEDKLFNQHQIPKTELRYYWIDNDGDEVDMIKTNERDCLYFMKHFGVDSTKKRVFVTPKNVKKAEPTPTTSPSTGFVHKRISCDECQKAEIVGFRYKCLQCRNYDLCENCEKQHVHSHHVMLRMPDDTFRNSTSALKFGLSHFNSGSGAGCPFPNWQNKKNAGTQSKRFGCPFVKLEIPQPNSSSNNGATTASASTETTDTAASTAAAATVTKEPTCKKNKQDGQQQQSSGISKLFSMLNDLAESAATSSVATEANFAATATEATKLAQQASQVAQQAATQAVSSLLLNVNNMTAQNAHKTTSVETAAANGNENVTTTTPNEVNNNSNENTASTSSVNAGGLDSSTPYLEPMKQGIQILNNFSDLFAKMLDSMETAGSSAASTALSAAASVADASTTTSTSSNEDLDKNTEKQTQQEGEAISSLAEECVATAERRSPSIEGDWQILDNQSQQSTAAPDLLEGNSPTSNPFVNYTQLSNDLREHMELEERNIDNTQNSNNNTTTGIDIEERRFVPVYHAVERINNAVLAMMAMGFSNEGSWLTQLVESVDGNISEALDLMNAAQRGNQRN